MAIFVTQGRFTREYIRSGLAKPEDRQAAISRLCEQAGGKLLNCISRWVIRFLLVSECRMQSRLGDFAGRLGGGGIQDVVTPRPPPPPKRALFEQAAKVAGSYKPMGAS